MACTLGPLVNEANQAAAAAYEICEVDPSGLELTPEELEITQESSWCQWQPTYNVPDISGYLPTLVTLVKDKVYEELWATLQAQIAALEANAAMVYSTKLERVTGDEAMAGQLEASYAQWESGSQALATSVQTALASQNYALSQQILETNATLDGKITANSEFYQTSLASVGETMAASGVLNSVTLADGRKVVSGFRSQASSETGSEFTIFADTFKILNRTPNGTGGYDYSSVLAPFTVQNDTVYIGKVNTSEPQITYLGEFASAPSTAGLDKNTVYKNAVDGNSYIFNGTGWVVWLVKGATGPTGPRGYDGANGTRGSIHITVNGTYSSGSATSSAFQSATGLYDKVIGDWVTFNSSGGATDYYRLTNGSDTWVNAALYVNGNMIVAGTIGASQISTNYIYTNKIFITEGTPTAYSVYKGYAETSGSTVAFGGVYKGSAYGYGIYGALTSSAGTGSAGVHGTSAGSPGSSGVSGAGSGSSVAGVYGTHTGTGNAVQGTVLSGGTGTGVSGSGPGWAVTGDTSNSLGQWGFITGDKVYATSGYFPFTGAHVAYSLDATLMPGDVVVIDKTFAVNISQTYSVVSRCSVRADKTVLGVVSYVKDYDVLSNFLLCKDACDKEDIIDSSKVVETGEVIETVVDTLYVPKQEYAEYANIIMTDGYVEIGVNALGEGMINVCSEGGDIEIGDYLCSSNVPGKAMKQDDDLLHNYTVAKATQYVKWANEPTTTKMIACTYHCG